MSLRSRYRAFTIERKSPGASAVDVPTTSAVGTFLGFVQPVSGSELAAFGGLQESITHRLYTDVATPVQYGDEIVQDGVRWRAVFTTQTTGISSVDHHKEVVLSYVR